MKADATPDPSLTLSLFSKVKGDTEVCGIELIFQPSLKRENEIEGERERVTSHRVYNGLLERVKRGQGKGTQFNVT